MAIDKNYIMYALDNKVSSLLREEYLPKEKPIESIFQIIYEPSFSDRISFELFKSTNQKEKDDYFFIKSIWDKDEDYRRLDKMLPVELRIKYNKGEILPTIKHEKICIEKIMAEKIVKDFTKINISPIIRNINKCSYADGTSYELRIKSIFNKCYFKWHEEGPDNWKELTDTVSNLINYLLA